MPSTARPQTALPFVPSSRSLRTLAAAVQHCRGCQLYERATQAVFGDGTSSAQLVLVGEQPGDHEDKVGRPFVGPAGRLLADALAAAGIPPERIYVTNAVKHFKWLPRGKRRMHQTPRWSEVQACRPWLDAELAAILPAMVVCLGATAGRAMLGSAFRLGTVRGTVIQRTGDVPVLATYHPSAVLRAAGREARDAMFATLVADLVRAAEAAAMR